MRAFFGASIVMAAATLFIGTALAEDSTKVDAGEAVYNDYCSNCHGLKLVNSGQSFDLRRLRRDERQRFENSVVNGKQQMPPWRGVLEPAQIDALWAYVRVHANDR